MPFSLSSLPAGLQAFIVPYTDVHSIHPSTRPHKPTSHDHRKPMLCCHCCQTNRRRHYPASSYHFRALHADYCPKDCVCGPRYRVEDHSCDCLVLAHQLLAVNRSMCEICSERSHKAVVFELGPVRIDACGWSLEHVHDANAGRWRGWGICVVNLMWIWIPIT